MSLIEAVAADREGDLERAASLYEDAILHDEHISPNVLIDLAVLYWQATDIGMAAAKRLSHGFFATAGTRIPELLETAHRRLPASTDARFWSKYIAWADLGEPFTQEECRALLREDATSRSPALYLFMMSGGQEAEADALELLRDVSNDGTTLAKYIASVIHRVQRRAGRR